MHQAVINVIYHKMHYNFIISVDQVGVAFTRKCHIIITIIIIIMIYFSLVTGVKGSSGLSFENLIYT